MKFSILRKAISAPLIFVTSRDTGLDEARALSPGGDDYITKLYGVPIPPDRIKAVQRLIQFVLIGIFPQSFIVPPATFQKIRPNSLIFLASCS